MTPSLKIGITGNIGSGKSIVSTILRTLGIPVYDCDTEAKRLMQKDSTIRSRIVETFGKECYTSHEELNRKHLANIIFNDTSALQKINNIVHPRVKEDFINWSKKQKSTIVALESAILFEARLQDCVDKIVAIYADREICIQRICKRNNTTYNEALQRLDKQTSAEDIIAQSQYAICNNPDTPLLPQINTFLAVIRNKRNNK